MPWGHCRNGETKPLSVFTKVIRLKRYGRKRLVIVHEQQDLGDLPTFADGCAALGQSSRIETWSYRWTTEIFHEFGKQLWFGGGSGAQGGSRETPLPFELRSAVAAPAGTGFRVGNRKVYVPQGAITIGQKVRTIARDALRICLSSSNSCSPKATAVSTFSESLYQHKTCPQNS